MKEKIEIENITKEDIFTKIKKWMSKFFLLLKKYSLLSYIIIGIALFFLAMLCTAQMKSISNSEQVIEGKREAQLADDLVTLQKNFSNLKEKYEQNEKVVEEYQTNASTNNGLISSMKTQLDSVSAMAGTTNLKGEGIMLTLTDGSKVTNPSQRADSLVHDSDVLTVVNELKAAGAEAISVNGQRIVATSAIRCVGPVIQVNYQKVAAPFEIKAIGNSQYLESAMNIKNGVVDMLKELGVGVVVTRQNNVEIPKYEGTMSFKNATVVK
ncbi:MAG: DUF881 domain-containing protein [Clostridia bacterium]